MVVSGDWEIEGKKVGSRFAGKENGLKQKNVSIQSHKRKGKIR